MEKSCDVSGGITISGRGNIVTLDLMINLAGLALTFIIVPLGGLLFRWIFAMRPARRVLRLQRRGRIDVVAFSDRGPAARCLYWADSFHFMQAWLDALLALLLAATAFAS